MLQSHNTSAMYSTTQYIPAESSLLLAPHARAKATSLSKKSSPLQNQKLIKAAEAAVRSRRVESQGLLTERASLERTKKLLLPPVVISDQATLL